MARTVMPGHLVGDAVKGSLLILLAIVLSATLAVVVVELFPIIRSCPTGSFSSGSGGVVASITSPMSGSGGGGGTRQETTVAGLALEFMAKSRTGNGVLCFGMEHVAGPVRLPRDCPVGTWAWIRLGTEI